MEEAQGRWRTPDRTDRRTHRSESAPALTRSGISPTVEGRGQGSVERNERSNSPRPGVATCLDGGVISLCQSWLAVPKGRAVFEKIERGERNSEGGIHNLTLPKKAYDQKGRYKFCFYFW